MLVFFFSILAYIIGIGSMAGYFVFVQFLADRNLLPFSWSLILRDTAVFLVFPIQHSILARPAVKNKLPASLERPIYVATSGLAMWFVLLLWKPFEPVTYELPMKIVIDLIFYSTVFLIIFTTREMDHWRMFGVKQGYAAWKRVPLPPTSLKTDGIFGVIRHPLTSLFIVTLWAHSSMSASRLLFNILFTAYALAGTYFEERDLVKNFGTSYLDYRARVPAFAPRLKR